MNAAEPIVARLRGERPAVVVGDQVTTASALGVRTRQLAEGWIRLGVQPGDRALILLPPGPELAAAFLALVWVGAVPVLVEPGQAPTAWHARIATSRPAWVVADPRLRWVWRVPGLTPLLRRRGLPIPPRPRLGRRVGLPRARGGLADPPPVPRSPGDEALLVFTSGTTSAPRAVVHTHGNLPHFLAHIAAVVEGLDVSSYLAETPQQIFYALLLDATCHVVRGTGARRAQRTLEVLQRHEVAAWFGSPWTWTTWLAEGRPLPAHLRTILLGSSPVTRPFLRRLLDALPDRTTVRCVYGLTETGPVCTVDAREKLAFTGAGDLVGRPLPGIDLRTDGQVRVHSPSTAPRLLGEGGAAIEVGDWLDTGDLGRLEAGSLVLEGRAKDMILRRGVNLYPGLLEPALLDHVDEAALVGVFDGQRQDERVVLCYAGGSLPDLAPVLGQAEPDHVLALDALPRSGRQHKVDKGALRELARRRFQIPADPA